MKTRDQIRILTHGHGYLAKWNLIPQSTLSLASARNTQGVTIFIYLMDRFPSIFWDKYLKCCYTPCGEILAIRRHTQREIEYCIDHD